MKLTMTKSIIFSILTSSTSLLKSAEAVGRIVGGVQAGPDDYPYFVHLGGCGGSLVAPDVVLTAAHCEGDVGQKVIIGAYEMYSSVGKQVRTCKQWTSDPLYFVGGALNNDFSLCKLNKPVEIDESMVMLEINMNDSVPSVGEDLQVMGLGTLFSGGSTPDTLHHVKVPYISNKQCNKNAIYDGSITDSMLCAGFLKGGKDSCQGDSGGPIVKRTMNEDGSYVDTQVGVVSWGYGCAEKNKPGVYSRTSERFDWIKDTICNMYESTASFCGDDSMSDDVGDDSMSDDISCEDDEDFLWMNKRGKGKNCKKFLTGKRVKRNKRKCNKKYKGSFVYDWCPETCAEKAMVGPCSSMN